jgi:hypothetical protein
MSECKAKVIGMGRRDASDPEVELWIREVAWLRGLLERVAKELDRLALQPGRTEADRVALQRRAARIRERLFQRSREPTAAPSM